ncbi:Aminomethyltransferase [compost metagenome]|nr:hypothetical protein N184_23185 [Sinorhizobium sp. GL28]
MKAIGYGALNRARIEAGFIVANADFITAEAALRADRERMLDEVGLDWLVDTEKPFFNGRDAIFRAREKNTLKHALVGLEIDGNIPAEGAIVYHRGKKEVGLVTAAIWSPLAKRNIAIASLARPFGSRIVEDLWVEIYALRELQYQKLMKRARVVARPFVSLPDRFGVAGSAGGQWRLLRQPRRSPNSGGSAETTFRSDPEVARDRLAPAPPMDSNYQVLLSLSVTVRASP